MKKAYTTIISLCLLSLFLTTPVSADSITLGFDQPVNSGTDLTINLVISGLGVGTAPSLGVYDLNITYNPAMVSFNSVAFGNQLDLGMGSMNGSDSTIPGTVNLYELSFADPAYLNTNQADKFVLATLIFSTIATGSVSLGIDNVILGDADGNALSAVVATPVPLPGSLLLIGSGLGSLVGLKKRFLG